MKVVLAALTYFAVVCVASASAHAAVIDKIAAFVDDEAITLSELEETYDATRQVSPDITRREVLNTMINRVLLLREARRLRLESTDEDQLLDEYIDLKVRAFIKVDESEITDFYERNSDDFVGRNYSQVRDQIEAFLLEREVNYRIRRHLEGLKENSYIKILLMPD